MIDSSGPAASFGQPICDAHHHLFDTAKRRYALDDFRRDIAGLPVVKSVFVECGEHYHADGPTEYRPVGETSWVAGMDDGGLVAAIVGYADLSAANIADILAAHIEAGRGRFRGVRQGAAWDSAAGIAMTHVTTRPGMLNTAPYVRGVTALASAALVCDVYVYFHQLTEVARLARAVDTTIVLNHLGGILGVGDYATNRSVVMQNWRAQLATVAACSNVHLKVGGLGRPLAGTGWNVADAQPDVDDVVVYWREDVLWAIELFGASRCIFESNFPVDRQSFSYATCWQTLDRIVADFSPGERQALFHDNAVRVYRLTDDIQRTNALRNRS